MALSVDTIDQAIEAIATGAQSYRLPDGTEVTRANLDSLRKLRREVEARDDQAVHYHATEVEL